MGSLFLTKVARCMSFRHWRSSVGSEIGVPKEANILSKGMSAVLGRNFGQFVMQFGLASAIMYDVKCFVSVRVW